MNIYTYRQGTSVYVEGDVDFTIEDFDVTYSSIHHAEYSKSFLVEVELVPNREDLKEVMEKLGVGTNTTRSTFRKTYDFRGRRTEEQRQEAMDEAKKALNEAIDSGKYEQRIFGKIEERVHNRIEYNNRQYINSIENDFGEHDHMKWDNVKDEGLEEVQEELDEVERELKILQDKKRELKELKRFRKNELFLEFLEEEGLDGVFEVDYPERAKEMVKEMAENNELFNVQSFGMLR